MFALVSEPYNVIFRKPMKTTKKLAALLVSALACAAPLTATAGPTLIGDSVRLVRSFNGSTFYDATAIVQGGGAPEFVEVAGGYSVDLDSALIRFDTGNSIGQYGGAPHYFDVLDIDVDGGITGFTFSSIGITNVDASDVSFTANSMRINIAAMQTVAGAHWEVRLEFGQVPEPSSVALVAAALAGLLVARGRGRLIA